jgi:hypothetical protein
MINKWAIERGYISAEDIDDLMNEKFIKVSIPNKPNIIA